MKTNSSLLAALAVAPLVTWAADDVRAVARNSNPPTSLHVALLKPRLPALTRIASIPRPGPPPSAPHSFAAGR